ncbi:metabotropic glutamate receptor 2-like [Diadema antillarum]|uniref:metabotropic glutamate receptor 2-like n=1 Tax=Diadema antillarum TaxID=105358 RepID=UPI003A8B0525
MRMSPNTSTNPWLEDFLEKYGLCEDDATVNGTCASRSFEGVEGLDNPVHETIVMDCVLAFANALHDMQVTLCGDPNLGLCEAMQQSNGTVLRNALLKTKFVSPVNGDLEFMPNGDMGGRYSIRNLQLVEPGKYEFLHVGTWVDSAQEKLTITTTIPWYLTGNSTLWDNTTGDPQSVCSTPCDTGEKRTVLPENPCCWSCTPCQTSEIVINNGTVCDSCIKAEENTYGWPDELRTGCVPLSPAVNNAWVTAIVILSAFGLFGTILTIAIYVHNREKPLIKASSRELSYIIFTGLVLAFLTSMLFGIKPNPGVCALRRIGSPVALSLIYVSIATKTIRLYRIFRAGLKSARRPRFISPTSQVTLTLVICIVPVVWATAWFILIPPAVEITMPDPNEPKIELACDESDIEVIGTITWEICLIMVCCVFAFVTRKLPENYNESRFITFCVFSSLVVFSSFAPAFFTTREAVYKASYSALGLIINGTVTLMCLFVVKIYALYFVDERELNIFTQSRTRSNTRTNSMINVHTSEGSIPPANPTSPSGPQVNHGFKTEAADKRDVEAENLNHSSNNNNRLSLPPIQTSQTMEVVGRVNHSSELQTFERDVGRSRSSSKNSVGGSGRGASGSLMTRLRGNSSRVGDTGASRVEQSLDRRQEVSSMHTKGDESGKHHALGQLQRFSADSDSSQGDDHRVLLNVKKAHREAVS